MYNNLVIGIYEGLPVNTKRGGINIFLKSLRKVNQNCEIIIWCQKDKYNNEYKNLENKYNCLFITYNSFLDSHIQTRRLYLTKFFLEKHKYNNILMTDIEDVFFQRDPFKIHLNDKDFYCALENNNYSSLNKASKVNLGWLLKLPISDFTVFKDEYVACSGTIYGKYHALLDYLKWVYDYRRAYSSEERGIDQGYWNEYVYLIKRKQKFMMEKIGTSKIMTCDNLPFFRKNNNNIIINDDNQEYFIIHQINRIPGSKNYIINLNFK